MARRQAIEAAPDASRDAERRLVGAVDGEAEALAREVARHRDEFQRLSAEHMVEWMDELREAESRRSHATPSTLAFHEAARDTREIAAEIWRLPAAAARTRPDRDQQEKDAQTDRAWRRLSLASRARRAACRGSSS